MDADLWAARFAASKRYQPSLQIRSGADLQFNLDDFEDEEDLRAEFPCPFFSENFNIAGLCCHIDEEHSVQAKNGVQRRRKFRKGSSHSTLSLLSKELWEGHLQSLLAASSYPVASSSTVPDPLLSSFIYNMPLVDAPSKQESHLPIEGVSDKKPADEKVTQRDVWISQLLQFSWLHSTALQMSTKVFRLTQKIRSEASLVKRLYQTRSKRRALANAASCGSFCCPRFLRTRYERFKLVHSASPMPFSASA